MGKWQGPSNRKAAFDSVESSSRKDIYSNYTILYFTYLRY